MNASTAKSRPKRGKHPTAAIHFKSQQQTNMEIPLEHYDRRRSQTSALNNESIQKRLHSKQEVARAVGVSPRKMDAWMAEKRIPFLRLSARLIRFDLERVLGALKKYEIKEVGVRK